MSADVDWGHTDHVELGDGTRLLVRSTEATPTRPVLLVLARHGGNSLEFASVADDLAGHWCVVGVDVRGSGGSDWLPEDRGYSQQQWAADLVEVIERTGLEPTAAIGVSVGGLLIMDLHQRGALRLDRAAVVDIAPAWPEVPDPAAAAERMMTTQQLLVASYPDAEAITEAWRTVQAEVWPGVDDEVVARSAAACTVEGEDGWRFACDVAGFMTRPPADPPTLDRWDAWVSLTAATDTLVVRGGTSELLTEEAFERMIVGSRTRGIVAPGVGHWPPLELDPTRSNLVDWLTS
ncbi:MAG: alpha/beta hydrolase [Actinomycetota bacterium]